MKVKEEKIKQILNKNVVSVINDFRKVYYENYYKRNKWEKYNEVLEEIKKELEKIDKNLILKFEKRAISTKLKEWYGWKLIN